jgi:glutamyl-tRNA synthetase
MSKSGALIDMDKLHYISADYVATLSATEIRDAVFNWAQKYDTELSNILKTNWDYAATVIDVDRFNNGKVRKDLFKWSDFNDVFGFFFKEQFKLISDAGDSRFEEMPVAVIQKVLLEFSKSYEEQLDSTNWFEVLKTVSRSSGFALNNKEYKLDPDQYHGLLRDVTNILRVAITGKSKGPGLHDLCDTLGKDEISRRLSPLLS